MGGHGSLTDSHKRFLRSVFPGDALVLDPEAMSVFGADASRRSQLPWAVVRPAGEQQVQELLAWAQAERVPIIPRARATNVVGGCVPVTGGVVVSTLRLNAIKDLDPDDFVAVVEPGVVTATLQAEARKLRLFYPPDPASHKVSTLGGNVATGAGGMRALKYGVTRDFVLGARVVLPGGGVIQTGARTHKNVVGLDLTRLLVGSEGTLGLITELTLKLVPLPEASASALASFPSLASALAGAKSLFAAGMIPSALEFMAFEAMDAVSRLGPVPWASNARAVLLIRLDGSLAGLREEVANLSRLLDGALGLTLAFSDEGAQAEEALWEPRRLVSQASFRLGPDKLSDDVTVPRGRVAEAASRYRAIGTRAGVVVVIFGHLGDGNIHVNVMYDASDASQAARAREAMDEIIRTTLELGGTLSGEHGVGLSKLGWLDAQLGPQERQLMQDIKRVFDPCGIMNPGKGY